MLKFFYLNFLICIFFIQTAYSKTDSSNNPKIFIMDSIVVTASRIPALYSSTLRIVHNISNNEIINSPVQSINCLLKNIPNVDVRQRGPFDVQSDIGIRGGTFDQTLILVNGIKVNDAQTGHHNLDLPLSIFDIEKIEVLEGSGSRVLGPNAFGGAINFITKEVKENELSLNISGGEFGFFNLSGSLSYNIGNLNNYLSLAKTGSSGYITDTDFQNWNIFYQGGISTAVGNFNANIGYTKKDFGANSFYTPAFPNQYESTNTLFVSAKYSTGDKLKYTVNLYYRQHSDKFELFRNYPESWYPGHNYHLTNNIGGSSDFSLGWLGGNTSFGVELHNENINSNVLGNATGDSINVPGEPGAYFTKYASRDNLSLFFEHNVNLKNFYLSGGFMINWITDYNWETYGGFDAGYKINDKLHIISSINQSFRVPTFTDLYYSGPSNIGNPKLKPEEAVTYEVGIKYLNENTNSFLTLFHRDGKDIIDWIRSADTLLWQSMNLTNVSSIGTEFSFSYYPTEKILNILPIKSVMLSYTYIWMSKQSGNFLSNYVLDYLKHKLTFNLQYMLYDDLGVNWKVLLESREGTYLDAASNTEKDYQPFLLLDAQIYYNFKSFRFYVEGTNLLNTFYRDHSYVPTPGRWLICGFSHNLKLDDNGN
ncbi:MAG: TonB-dependent receptor [Bacteroidetes bacterium]|nr:TonB-dependent receptor [Bacteroidota bacterium]